MSWQLQMVIFAVVVVAAGGLFKRFVLDMACPECRTVIPRAAKRCRACGSPTR